MSGLYLPYQTSQCPTGNPHGIKSTIGEFLNEGTIKTSGELAKRPTEIEAIINLADSNKSRTYRVAERISQYLDRQVGPRPSADEGNSELEPTGNIFAVNTILNREAQCLMYIEQMLSHLEEIG